MIERALHVTLGFVSSIPLLGSLIADVRFEMLTAS
jgi:hypothetical protein